MYVVLHLACCCFCVAVSSAAAVPHPLAPRSTLTPHGRPSLAALQVAASFNQYIGPWDVRIVEYIYAMLHVRAPPSRVLLLLHRRVVVIGRPLCPRSEIATHSTRPPVPRCAVESPSLQSAHRCMERELDDDHEGHVLCTCSSIPRVAALASLCRCVVVGRPLSPRSAIATHSTRPPVPRCAVECPGLQSAHR